MLLKILFLAIVLYYVVKTSRALIRAISGQTGPSHLDSRQRDRGGWQGASTSSSNGHRDVEDAKYVDIK